MKRVLGLVCVAALCGSLAAGWGARAAAPELPEANVPASACSEQLGTAELPAPRAYEELAAPASNAPASNAEPEVLSDEGVVTEELYGSPDVSEEYISPLVTCRADPYLYKHDGTYYFTGSYPQYDRIELTSADSVNGIAAAVPKEIWHMDAGFMEKYVWAPEIHYIMDQWVIYFAYSQGGPWDIKCCALRCTGDDPMQDDWEYMGVMNRPRTDSFSFNSMSLDMTVFYHEELGRWYAIWAQKPGYSNLYIARLADPFTIDTEPMLLSQPDYNWEHGGNDAVDEGPAVMKHAGKIFVSFSGSTTGASYCMGMLEIDACDDPLVKSNWTKYAEPVYQTDASLKVYGPGHNCFVEGDHGEQLCILHFRDYRDISGDSLFDFNRHAHVMKVTFDRDGVPHFNLTADELYNSDYHNENHS